MKKETISLIEKLFAIKKEIEINGQDPLLKPHLIIGIELSDDGHPLNVINFPKANAINGAGMIEFLQSMLNTHKDKLVSGFQTMLVNPNAKKGAGQPDPTMYKDLMVLINKYDQEILSAMDSKDVDALARIKETILTELSNQKGYAVNLEINFGELVQESKKNENRGFNLNKGFLGLQ